MLRVDTRQQRQSKIKHQLYLQPSDGEPLRCAAARSSLHRTLDVLYVFRLYILSRTESAHAVSCSVESMPA